MEKKDYINNITIEEERGCLRTWLGLQHLVLNYSHNRKCEKCDWLFRCKIAKEDKGHIMLGNCDVYSDLRSQVGDLGEDQNLIEFF